MLDWGLYWVWLGFCCAVRAGRLDERYLILTDEKDVRFNIVRKHLMQVLTWCW